MAIKFGTLATLSVAGLIKDVKFTPGDDDKLARLTFQLGKENYRGADNKAEWANYHVSVVGKTAEKLNEKKFFGNGCLVAVSGEHDQKVVMKEATDEYEARAFVYNNIRTTDVNMILTLKQAIAAGIAKAEDSDDGGDDAVGDDDFPID